MRQGIHISRKKTVGRTILNLTLGPPDTVWVSGLANGDFLRDIVNRARVRTTTGETLLDVGIAINGNFLPTKPLHIVTFQRGRTCLFMVLFVNYVVGCNRNPAGSHR